MIIRPNTQVFGARFRRALNHHYGRPGLATREEIRNWIDATVRADAEVICSDLDEYDRTDGEAQS